MFTAVFRLVVGMDVNACMVRLVPNRLLIEIVAFLSRANESSSSSAGGDGCIARTDEGL